LNQNQPPFGEQQPYVPPQQDGPPGPQHGGLYGPSQYGEPQQWAPAEQPQPSIPGHRARPPRKRRRVINIVALSVIGLAVVIIIVVSLSGGSHSSSPSAATTPSAPVPAAPAAQQPTSAPAETTAEQVQAWAQNGGTADMNAVEAALTSISNDAPSIEAGDFAPVEQDCDTLGTAISNLQAYGPIPYQPAEAPYSQALALYAAGASDCSSGAASQNVSQITQATSDFSQADSDLSQATNAIESAEG
jgi:hypothetical protein